MSDGYCCDLAGCPAGENACSYDETRFCVCSPNDTIHSHSALQTAWSALLEQNGCNWIRGINVSHWHLHVGKDNCRVAGETEKGEDGEE